MIDGDGHSTGLVCVSTLLVAFLFFFFRSNDGYFWTYVSACYHLYIIQARMSMLSADASETGVFIMYLFF